MPALENPRHEAFAQEVAAGRSKQAAYAKAFSRAADGAAAVNANRLLKRLTSLSRVEEIRAKAARKAEVAQEEAIEKAAIDLEGLIARADKTYDGALAAGQFGAAVSAIKEMGILTGFRVERSTRTNYTFTDLSDDELLKSALEDAAKAGIAITLQ